MASSTATPSSARATVAASTCSAGASSPCRRSSGQRLPCRTWRMARSWWSWHEALDASRVRDPGAGRPGARRGRAARLAGRHARRPRSCRTPTWSSWSATLRRAGLVTATRGKAGGYRLARPPAEISLVEAMRALDGPILEMPCAGPDEPGGLRAAAGLQRPRRLPARPRLARGAAGRHHPGRGGAPAAGGPPYPIAVRRGAARQPLARSPPRPHRPQPRPEPTREQADKRMTDQLEIRDLEVSIAGRRRSSRA